jgi:hypothetical protein
MPSCLGNRIRAYLDACSIDAQKFHVLVSHSDTFTDLRTWNNDTSSSFVGYVFGKLPQHADAVKLNPRHHEHQKDGNGQSKFDYMSTASLQTGRGARVFRTSHE